MDYTLERSSDEIKSVGELCLIGGEADVGELADWLDPKSPAYRGPEERPY